MAIGPLGQLRHIRDRGDDELGLAGHVEDRRTGQAPISRIRLAGCGLRCRTIMAQKGDRASPAGLENTIETETKTIARLAAIGKDIENASAAQIHRAKPKRRFQRPVGRNEAQVLVEKGMGLRQRLEEPFIIKRSHAGPYAVGRKSAHTHCGECSASLTLPSISGPCAAKPTDASSPPPDRSPIAFDPACRRIDRRLSYAAAGSRSPSRQRHVISMSRSPFAHRFGQLMLR